MIREIVLPFVFVFGVYDCFIPSSAEEWKNPMSPMLICPNINIPLLAALVEMIPFHGAFVAAETFVPRWPLVVLSAVDSQRGSGEPKTVARERREREGLRCKEAIGVLPRMCAVMAKTAWRQSIP